jgi:stage V sporulation protein S
MLKVAANSNPHSVAGAIAGSVRESQRAEIQAIGAGAVNQAIKAVAIARNFLQNDGIDLVCVPGFAQVEVEGEQKTAIRLVLEPRKKA